jgi:hypothetical protein
MIFKKGEKIVCVDVSQKTMHGFPLRPDLESIKKWKTYIIVNTIPYSNNITIINEFGKKQAYTKRRFRPISEFRNPKINKIIKNIKSD